MSYTRGKHRQHNKSNKKSKENSKRHKNRRHEEPSLEDDFEKLNTVDDGKFVCKNHIFFL